MSAIRGKDTKPELQVRRALHAAGFRYRLHAKDLPGTPDLVLPKYKAVVFVHGCFWHQHDCSLFKWPAARANFWRQKLAANVARDRAAYSALRSRDWRIATVWECSMKGRRRLAEWAVGGQLAEWLRGDDAEFELGESKQ
jgi:DNA mismatch endonuclease (patch repair protein)